MIIYKTTNLINNRIYIGSDSHNNPNYFGSGKILKLAIKKYGKESFKKEVIEYCETKKELKERETFWIRKLKPFYPLGYNISNGYFGGDVFTNHPNKKEYSENLSKGTKLAYINDPTIIDRIVIHSKGKTYEEIYGERAEEEKYKRSINNIGKKKSKYNSSNTNKGKKLINNDIISKWVKEEDLDYYLSLGWKKGQRCDSKIYINKGELEKHVDKKDVNDYLDNGWELGCSCKHKKAVSISKKGIKFTDEHRKNISKSKTKVKKDIL